MEEQQPQSQEEEEEEGLALGLGFQPSQPTLSSSSDPNCDPSFVEDELKRIAVGDLRKLSLEESLNQEDQNHLAVEKPEANDKTTTDYWGWDDENKSRDGHRSEVGLEEKEADVRSWSVDTEAKVENDDENEMRSSKSEGEFDADGSEYDDAYGNFKEEEGFDEESDHRSENESENVKTGYNENEGGASENGRYNKWNRFPLRPGAEDCVYYMKTGTCKFGMKCKFNHPSRKKNQGTKEKVNQNEETQEKPAQAECKYYLTSGGCKFGKDCRYIHSRAKTVVAPILEFNFLGLPIRPGEKECPYYMRTGSCKYGSNCRFNHPEPTAGGNDPLSGHGNGGSVYASQPTMSSWSSPRTLNDTASYVPMVFPPRQGAASPNPEWNGYQAPSYPTSERSLRTPPAFAMSNPATETAFYPYRQQQMSAEEFPERPGQPECSYFLKTGDCKFKSNCKFHHPKNWIPNTAMCILSDKGLPLRPDQNICSHYNRYGICKFGPSCKFDHPVNFGNSASSPRPRS